VQAGDCVDGTGSNIKRAAVGQSRMDSCQRNSELVILGRRACSERRDHVQPAEPVEISSCLTPTCLIECGPTPPNQGKRRQSCCRWLHTASARVGSPAALRDGEPARVFTSR